VLAGFAMFAFFGIGRAMLKAGIFPQLNQSGALHVLSRLLLYGFVLSALVVVAAFGLKYRELSRAEQVAAVRLIDRELGGDLEIASELQKNTHQILNISTTLATILRRPNLKIPTIILPLENTSGRDDLPATLEMARSALERAREEGVLDDPGELNKFQKAAQAVTGTIGRTRSAIVSLSDLDGTRYVFKTEAWEANLPIMRRVDIIDVTQFQSLHQDLVRLRTNYGVVVRYSLDYIDAIDLYLSARDRLLDAQSISDLLAAERLYFQTVTVYAKTVEEKIKAIEGRRIVLGSMG